MTAKKALALAQFVHFSTKRAREIGKLPPKWTQCLVPLVNSSTVKIQGKLVFPTIARVPNDVAEVDAGDIALC
ncbi:OSJNBa0096F01.3-like protein [Zea mays]|uniref:OSJNBa0096F01.3-like protein n=1 Tax=Zea mays TaxID=4577 RepID=A0A1D6E7U7_MAIZE|nr:OSJNBa0096F01.3-like protein [Zea mays]